MCTLLLLLLFWALSGVLKSRRRCCCLCCCCCCWPGRFARTQLRISNNIVSVSLYLYLWDRPALDLELVQVYFCFLWLVFWLSAFCPLFNFSQVLFAFPFFFAFVFIGFGLFFVFYFNLIRLNAVALPLQFVLYLSDQDYERNVSRNHFTASIDLCRTQIRYVLHFIYGIYSYMQKIYAIYEIPNKTWSINIFCAIFRFSGKPV